MRYPVLFAFLISLLLWPLLSLEASIVFKGHFFPQLIQQNALWLGIFPGILIATAVFFLLRQQFSKNDNRPHVKGYQIKASYWIIASFMAVYIGLATTLITHGKQGPWGSVFEGLKSPLTQGFLPLFLWPVIFLAGMAITLYFAYNLWQKMLSIQKNRHSKESKSRPDENLR